MEWSSTGGYDSVKVLFIGDVFEEKYEESINRAAKVNVEYSSVLFQRKILSGFEAVGIHADVISAPAVGAFPQRSRWIFCKSLGQSSLFRYVPFCNIWGYRNLSQTRAIKKVVRRYLQHISNEKILIYVYSAHNPFIAAARYAKVLRPDVKICFIVPDLPQYMNLEGDRSAVYDFFKKYDTRTIINNSKCADAFLVLTEQMKDNLYVGSRPCIVQEGIVQSLVPIAVSPRCDSKKRIVYTGKLYKQFGIPLLVDTFMKMHDVDLELILCGTGDAKDYVVQCAKQDIRIDYRGFVSVAEAAAAVRSADVLVNPRIDHADYTKYSFPSKNLEYLMSGHPVVACMLDGIPPEYQNFMYCFSGADDFAAAIRGALAATDQTQKYQSFLEYASKKLTAESVAHRLLDILGG